MSRIIFAWELGGDLGHISSFLPVALALRDRGHEVLFAVRDLSNTESLLAGHGFNALQAPLFLPKVSGLPHPPLNYTEIMMRYGYVHKLGLKALVKAWLQLFAYFKPDVLIADHSPVALLAGRAANLPRALFGIGFCSPPRLSPLPNMRPWLKVPAERLQKTETVALRIANNVLTELNAPPLARLADLFEVDEDFLCTFKELDQYPARGEARYWGSAFSLESGIETKWPAPEGKRVFAYIKSAYGDFEKVLQALHDSPCVSLVYAAGITRKLAQKYANPRMIISFQPLKLAPLLPQCDLGVCHAGHGTIGALLLAGVPMLLLPTQVEQYLAARRVEALGAGLLVNPERKKDSPPPVVDYGALIARLTAGPSFRDKARAVAARYADFSQTEQAASMAARVEEIIAARGGKPAKSARPPKPARRA